MYVAWTGWLVGVRLYLEYSMWFQKRESTGDHIPFILSAEKFVRGKGIGGSGNQPQREAAAQRIYFLVKLTCMCCIVHHMYIQIQFRN
eukprot:m.251053 g.251053  ORF g.251053 m.251053 type:complete len:88 (-) comp129581_c0_seq1:41-304(-)